MPPLPLPPPLRGTDGGFTADSIRRRLPLILDETLAHNDGNDGDALPPTLRAALLALREEIVRDAPLAPLAPHPSNTSCGFGGQPGERDDAPADDGGGAHATDGSGGATWLSATWFHVENAFYRRILDACRAAGWERDPFARQKAAALRGAAAAFAAAVLPLARSLDVGALLLRSLWGNRHDLSLFTVAALAAAAHGGGEADALLVDETAAAVRLLRAGSPGTVAILLDNCGLELLADLALADGLLRAGCAAQCLLIAKRDPVFVSDVVGSRFDDVGSHLAWLDAADGDSGDGGAAALAARLRAALASGALQVRDDPFLNSPLPFWALPPGGPLHALLAGCRLVIAKGDANYRRLLGDRHWKHDTPFADVTREFPAPLLALRTCKAGVVCGLPAPAEARAAAADPADWLVSGKYGLAQLGGAAPAAGLGGSA